MSRQKSGKSPDGTEYAAEQAESQGEWRRAYGFWKDLISEYSAYVNNDRLSYWKEHKEYCDQKMRESL